MRPLLWALSGLLLLLCLYFLLCALLVRRFLHRKEYDFQRHCRQLEHGPLAPWREDILRGHRWLAGQPGEDVYLQSFDGLRLHARYLTQPGSARGVILLAHGFQSSGEWDFGCILEPYFQMGFDLLLIDQRAHLQSQGRYLTMGVRESRDVADWCRWLAARRGPRFPIVLDGISMGATSVLLAAGSELPESVVGVIADCPFTSPRGIFRSVMAQLHLPRFLLWGAGLCCRVMAGFSIDGGSTTEALSRCTLPLLMAHGEADDFVPCAMGKASFEAAASADKQLILVPGAGHGMSYLVDRPRVHAALTGFLDRLCPPTDTKS